MKKIVDREAPVHKDIVKRRICDAFDIRLGSKIETKIEGAIFWAVNDKRVILDGEFLLSPKKKTIPLRIYVDGDIRRQIEKISPDEIEIAIYKCLKNSLSISVDDLCREIAKLFGLRVTENVKEYLVKQLNKMVSDHKVELRNDRIRKVV